MKKAIFNWSGGKDSSLALYHVLQSGAYSIEMLLTTLNSQYNRISMHGVRAELLRQQVQSLGFNLTELNLPEDLTMKKYDQAMQKQLQSIIEQTKVTHSIFGDIFLEDLKKYRERKSNKIGLQTVFPLWKRDTKDLGLEFIKKGFKTIVVCADGRYMDKDFIGRQYDERFLEDLPKEVDPCGENGEFHTFTYDGPIFKNKIEFTIGEKVFRKIKPPRPTQDKRNKNQYECKTKGDIPLTGFWYCDLIPFA